MRRQKDFSGADSKVKTVILPLREIKVKLKLTWHINYISPGSFPSPSVIYIQDKLKKVEEIRNAEYKYLNVDLTIINVDLSMVEIFRSKISRHSIRFALHPFSYEFPYI